MAKLRTILFYCTMLVWLFATGLLALPVLLFPQRWALGLVRFWTKGNRVILKYIGGVTFNVRGLENQPRGGALIASQHQSIFETIFAWVYLDAPATVMKKNLAMFPVAGWYALKMGCIPVDRNGGAKALRQMTRDCKATIDRGQQVIIYPEGTRSDPGTLRPLKPGIAGIYAEVKAPCIPVVLNSGDAWPANQFAIRPGVITLEFLEPIEPGLPRKEFMTVLNTRLANGFARIEAET